MNFGPTVLNLNFFIFYLEHLEKNENIYLWIQDKRYNKYATVSVQAQNNLTTQTSVSQTILNRSGGSHASYTHHSGHNLPLLPGLPSNERDERMSITINQGHLMQGQGYIHFVKTPLAPFTLPPLQKRNLSSIALPFKLLWDQKLGYPTFSV